jgi:hypothetical protein
LFVGTDLKWGLRSTIANNIIFAKDLNNCTVMSYMGMPYGPDCYFPRKDAVDRILNDVSNVPKDKLQLMDMTDEFRSMYSYIRPLEPEEDYNRENLKYIMDLVHGNIEHSFRANISVKSGGVLHEYFSSHLCSRGSLEGPAILYGRDTFKCGLCASESKGVYSGVGEALAQGVGMAAEMAADQASKGIQAKDILVPFILVFGESVQFGAVFVIDPSFPCPFILSTSLSLISWEGRNQVTAQLTCILRFIFFKQYCVLGASLDCGSSSPL